MKKPALPLRWTMVFKGPRGARMRSKKDGSWVKYRDYEELEAYAQALEREIADGHGTLTPGRG